MAKKDIESYAHRDKERANNPPVGLVTPATDKDAGKKTYAHDPHPREFGVDVGKAEHASFEVPTVSLHVHERIDPRTIVEAVRKRNGDTASQNSLFEDPAENPPIRQAIDFYRHRHNWTNRLVAGDSLLEKEGLGGKVQMVCMDPPYGIRYGSFWWLGSRQHEAYRDDFRQDAAILCDLLDLPTSILEPLETLRLAWCSEPTVHGGKSTRP